VLAANFQAGFAQPFEQVLDKLSVPPLLQFVARYHGKVWPEGQQFADRISRCHQLAELTVGYGERAPGR
jgi:hypothetical protein